MNDFKENNCNVCKKVFCCKKCREKHEIKQHNIFPGCDICISGKTLISTTEENVISHIKMCHWPLHCVLCKRLFGSVDELFQHIKCPLANKLTTVKSPYTPHHSYHQSIGNISPYFFKKNYYIKNEIDLKTISNLATSTPMQGECNNLLEKIQEVIVTPVDNSSEIKENHLEGSSCTNLKRKVTFCETPITESFSKKSKNMTSSTQGGSAYYTASEQTEESPGKIIMNLPLIPCIKISDSPVIIEEEDEEVENNKNMNIIRKSEETIWISAVNISTTEICKQEPISPDIYLPNNHFVTPMVPKGKKTNLVIPTITRKEEISITFSPVQISSTPKDSLIPIKTAPNLPCTSKSGLENWDATNCSKDTSESTSDYRERTSSLMSMSNNLWTSMTKMVKNVFETFSNTIDTAHLGTIPISRPLKRHCSDTDISESPMVKRYKVADIKCRRNIRKNMTPINKFMDKFMEARRKRISREFHVNIVNSLATNTTTTTTTTTSITKTFVDKATQTDEPFIQID